MLLFTILGTSINDIVSEPLLITFENIVKRQKVQDTTSPIVAGGHHVFADTRLAYEIPEKTAEVAQAIFPKGNLYLTLFDTFGSLFADPDFAALFPDNGQPALSPLSDRLTKRLSPMICSGTGDSTL